MITIYINNFKFIIFIKKKKNLTILQLCEYLKIDISRFCYHKELSIAGNCRMCLVEVKNSIKPEIACATPIRDNLIVFTNTPLVQKARENILEFLLLNHPLDCPICDQAGECDLQEHSVTFGSDLSRFFKNKRAVVDSKNNSLLIKFILTRCIHCTRCIRFLTQFSQDYSLGMVGRGSCSEISLYQNNLLINSEFSGNIIDLCPVGALTSKPFSFKARSWEIKKKRLKNILDNFIYNLNADIYQNKIIKITPNSEFSFLKNIWINNYTRFFFDSLNYQRVSNFFYKKYNILLVFKKLKYYFFKKHSKNNINIVLGSFIDIKSLYFLKKILKYCGLSNVFINSKKYYKISSNFIHNFNYNNLSNLLYFNYDFCLILGCYTRIESSILNLKLKQNILLNKSDVYIFGLPENILFKYTHIGNNFESLILLFEGKHFISKKLNEAKNPLIIIGSSVLYRKDFFCCFEFINFFNKYKKLQILWLNYNLFNNAFIELNLIKKKNFNLNKNDLLFLYNVDNNFNLNKNVKIISLNFFLINFLNKNINNILLNIPLLTFLEKNSFYLNFNKRIQKNIKIINNSLIKDDLFLKYFLYFLKKYKLNSQFFNNFYLFFNFLKIKNQQIFFNITKFKYVYYKTNNKFLFQNIYKINIFTSFSKILNKCAHIFKKNTKNFF